MVSVISWLVCFIEYAILRFSIMYLIKVVSYCHATFFEHTDSRTCGYHLIRSCWSTCPHVDAWPWSWTLLTCGTVTSCRCMTMVMDVVTYYHGTFFKHVDLLTCNHHLSKILLVDMPACRCMTMVVNVVDLVSWEYLMSRKTREVTKTTQSTNLPK